MVRYELATRGVANELAELSTNEIDDGDEAFRAAEKRARRLAREDPAVFRRRLTTFLASRGFNYGTIQRTIARLAECGEDNG
jgi:regulatory protein